MSVLHILYLYYIEYCLYIFRASQVYNIERYLRSIQRYAYWILGSSTSEQTTYCISISIATGFDVWQAKISKASGSIQMKFWKEEKLVRVKFQICMYLLIRTLVSMKILLLDQMDQKTVSSSEKKNGAIDGPIGPNIYGTIFLNVLNERTKYLQNRTHWHRLELWRKKQTKADHSRSDSLTDPRQA